MHNVTLVTVVDGRKNLLYYLSGINFTELLLLSYLVEELSSVTKFSDQEVAFLILEEFVKFQNLELAKDYAWMGPQVRSGERYRNR